jgi:hypothetical protein
MKTYGGMEVQVYAFLTSALDGGEWLALRPIPRLLYPRGKSIRYPSDRREAGWDPEPEA